MAGFVDTQEQAILNTFLRAATWTLPASLHFGLSTTTPTEAAANFTEPAGSAYARVSVTRNTSEFTAASGTAPAVADNTNVIQFPTPSGSWGTITHVGAFDASTSGNLLWWAALTTSQAIGTGNDVEFAAGALDFKIGDPGDTYQTMAALNTGSGVAARNGTTSHTISFGFTSTSGSLLVFVICGGVTHAATGWTERLSPVNSAELSVFTKTSAGDSSITVTHNGSNYPCAWYVWEWTTGSTWVNGAQETASDNTFPTLSSLPGTPVELGAAYCKNIGGSDPGSVSSTWDAGSEGWTEVLDSWTVATTTDGAYLTIATATGFTGTSTTPTGTFVAAGGTVPDRQKVVWAVTDAAAGGGTVALAAHGDTASGGSVTVTAKAPLAAHGDAAAGGSVAVSVAARLAAHGDTASGGSAALTVAVSLTAHGDTATGGTVELTNTPPGGVALTGHGDTASAGTAALTVVAVLAGHGDAAAGGTVDLTNAPPGVALTAHGDTANAGTAVLTVVVSLAAHGDLAAAGRASLTVFDPTAATYTWYEAAATVVGSGESAGTLAGVSEGGWL